MSFSRKPDIFLTITTSMRARKKACDLDDGRYGSRPFGLPHGRAIGPPRRRSLPTSRGPI